MDYINAFWVGGLICALAQILMEKTKMLPGRIMVLIVCLGAVLGQSESMNRSWNMREQEQVFHCLDLAMFCGKV